MKRQPILDGALRLSRLDGGLGAPRHHPEELLGGAPAVRADAQPAGDRPAGEAADDDDEGPGDEGRTQQRRVHARAEEAKDYGSSEGGPAGSQHAIRLGDAARLRRHPGEHALAQRQPHHHHLSPGGDSDESLRQRGESHLASVTARQPPPAMSTRWLARRTTVAPPTKRPCRSAPSLAVRHTERQAAAPSQPAPAPQSSSSPPKPTVCHAGLPPPEKTPPKTTP